MSRTTLGLLTAAGVGWVGWLAPAVAASAAPPALVRETCEVPATDGHRVVWYGGEDMRGSHDPRTLDLRVEHSLANPPVEARGPAPTTPVLTAVRVATAQAGVLPGCDSTGPPSCGGVCPPYNVCQATRFGSLEVCSCVGEAAVCGTNDPFCGGVCPPGLVCAGDVFGVGSCACEPPLPPRPLPVRRVPPPVPKSTTTSSTSTTTGTTTTTVREPACATSEYPACDGPCPSGEVCVAHVDRLAAATCACFPVPPLGIPCAQAGAPQCDGVCPKGTACMESTALARCVCIDVLGATCGFLGAPQCIGECPPARPHCRDDGSGGCVCLP